MTDQQSPPQGASPCPECDETLKQHRLDRTGKAWCLKLNTHLLSPFDPIYKSPTRAEWERSLCIRTGKLSKLVQSPLSGTDEAVALAEDLYGPGGETLEMFGEIA